MIRRTRAKIVTVTISIVMIFEVAMISFATFLLYNNIKKESVDFVQSTVASAVSIITPEGNVLVRFDRPEGEPEGEIERFKTFVSAYYNGDVASPYKEIVQNSSVYTDEEIKNISLTLVGKKDGNGKIDESFYAKRTLDNGVVVMAVIDCESELMMLVNFILRGLAVAIVGTICLSMVVWWISYFVTKPLKESIENEKRFISDTSHELKTPLTIISANAELLDDNGGKEWIDNIKFQTKRMQKLVGEMLELSRLDENAVIRRKIKHQHFSLSDETLEVVMPFDPIAYEKHIAFDYDIDKNISIISDPEDYKKVLGVLVENAVKYTAGEVRIALKKKGKSSYLLTVYNSGCGIKNEDKARVFERFYRSDASRAGTTGGSGLGLAIAKELSDKNNWKLSMSCQYDVYTEFRLLLKSE